MRVELYLDVLSSWCLLAAPAWTALRHDPVYEGRTRFSWSIALVDRAEAMGYTRESMDWYYRRTFQMTGERLRADWIDGPQTGTLNANLLVAAARTLGVEDDRVWIALGTAAMREGKPMGRFEAALEVAAAAGALDRDALAARARDEAILEYVRDGTERFRRLGLTQRPAFVVTDEIGDEARFSGIWVREPIAATLDALLPDVDGYRGYMLQAPPEPPLLPPRA